MSARKLRSWIRAAAISAAPRLLRGFAGPSTSLSHVAWRLALTVFWLGTLPWLLKRRGLLPSASARAEWSADVSARLLDRLVWLRDGEASRHDNVATRFAENNRLGLAEREAMRQWPLARRPLLSVLVAVHEAPADWIDRFVHSIIDQVYDHWELIVVDDGSIRAETRLALERLTTLHERIAVHHNPSRLGVAATLNIAARQAQGDFLAFLDHDDELTPDALWRVAERLNEESDLDVVTTDEECHTTDGRSHPLLKPDLSPSTLTAFNYICHLMVVRKSRFWEVGGFQKGTDAAQDFDLILRLAETTDRFSHIARVLYSWRITTHSLSRRLDARTGRLVLAPGVAKTARAVVQRHFDRSNINASPRPAGEWMLAAFAPIDQGKVSIIIPTRDQPLALLRAVRSIRRRTSYPNYEIVIVDNGSERWSTRQLLKRLSRECRVLRIENDEEGFSFARIMNLAAKAVDGEFLLFFNDDVRVQDEQWLSALVGFAGFPNVGACGAKLLFPSGRVQHAGLAVGGAGGVVAPLFRGQWPRDVPAAWLNFPRDVAAVTGACLLTPKATFLELGGFDESFPVAFNDVDYCLRLGKLGLRVVYAPQATLLHDEGRSRGRGATPTELLHFRSEHGGAVDPHWPTGYARWYPGVRLESRRRRHGFSTGIPRVLLADLDRDGRRLAGEPREIAKRLARQGHCEILPEPLGSRDWRSAIDRERPDVLWAIGPASTDAVIEASRAGVAVIWTLATIPSIPSRASREGRATFLKFLNALPLAYQVVLPHRFLVERWEAGRQRPNLTVAPTWPLSLDPPMKRGLARRVMNVDPTARVIVAASDTDGGWATLARAIPSLRTADAPPLIVWRANGTSEEVEPASFDSSLKRSGVDVQRIEPRKLAGLMAATDAVALHLTRELMNPVAFAAMTAGRPLLGTEELCHVEILFSGVNGLMARGFHARAWKEKLTRLMSSATERDSWGAASKQHLDSRRDVEGMLATWKALIDEAREVTRRDCPLGAASPLMNPNRRAAAAEPAVGIQGR